MPHWSDSTVTRPSRVLAVRRPLIVATSAILATTSYLAAFYVRADFDLPASWMWGIARSFPFLLVTRMFAFHHYGLLRGWWASTGMHDFLDIVKAVAVGSALFVTSVVLAFGVYAVPRSVVLIDALLMIGLLSGARLLSRAWGHSRARPKTDRVLVVGTFPSIEPLVRELLENPDVPMLPIGLIDLEGQRAGFRLHGVPILGSENDLPEVLRSTRIDTVVLALSTRDGATLRRILSRCGETTARFKIVPPLGQVLDERLQPGDLRQLEIDDLLGRSEIRLDVAALLHELLAGRTVLITGAAGSIGSELAHQVARYDPKQIVLLDRNEAALSALQTELRSAHPSLSLAALLCDIRDHRRIAEVFTRYRPSLVYHAAAYKHVPMMEMNPIEAVKNNVFGTRDLLEVADRHGVERFVLISTDKAVRPINIMGSTKRVAERLLEHPTGRGCRRIAVRFGNVLGSEGSLVPILMRQIRAGGPVTITHPEATRYFMTIPEAVQLVLQASALGQGGEIFVLEMGEPVRILDLATSLIRLTGLQPGRDIEIRITGLRPGERLHEEALIDSISRPTGTDRIWVRTAVHGPGEFAAELAVAEGLIRAGDRDAVLQWLRRVSEDSVPESAP